MPNKETVCSTVWSRVRDDCLDITSLAIDMCPKVGKAFRAISLPKTMAEASKMRRQTQKAIADGPGQVQSKHII
jgi:hypothetical protein